MIKIDLHIHTIASVSDAPFTFSLDRLKQYAEARRLDCIAITNHNIFDLDQFNEIKTALSITVLPGIEIDIEGGQLLLIDNGNDLKDFEEKCQKVSGLCPTDQDCITIQEFQEIFQDLSKYILIPHYEKKPKLPENILSQLKQFLTAGEVTSPKKFSYCLKDDERLVPVFFSDFRSSTEETKMPFRQTFLGCDTASFSAIKSCLRDKNKVALSETDGLSVFPIFEDGQKISTGLNVVLGERSSGKSYTLNRICKEFSNVKYIRQFSLVERNEEEDERKFTRALTDRESLLSKEYLEELQFVIQEIVDINLDTDERAISKYLETLLKNASESEKHDAFSNAKLYREEKFQTPDQKNLRELIDSTKHLVKNEEFKSLIEKHVSIQSLINLYVDLMKEYQSREQDRLKKIWLNDLIKEIKDSLEIKSAVTKIEDVDLYQVAMNLNKVQKFKTVVNFARKKHTILRRSLKGFEIVATAGEFEGAGELRKISKATGVFKDAFQQYKDPYLFLKELRNITSIVEADYHKCFVKIVYKILNSDGFEVSGGERSEYNLLQELEDAKEFDMLLIDEPESSFDNIFLKEKVNEHIKDISKNTPVVLVTHNNTVGASINPDYLLCTKKEISHGTIEYRIYSGFPTSKTLLSIDGKSLKTWDVLLGCLEAGEDTYNQRRISYEDIKN